MRVSISMTARGAGSFLNLNRVIVVFIVPTPLCRARLYRKVSIVAASQCWRALFSLFSTSLSVVTVETGIAPIDRLTPVVLASTWRE